MRRATFVVVTLVAIALGAAVYFSAIYDRPRQVSARRANVVYIQLYPYPEGKAIAFDGKLHGSSGVADIELIRDRIPDPLPPSYAGKRGCSGGQVLVMELKDGRTISYGHCKKPRSIIDLEASMITIYADYDRARRKS